LTSICPYKAEVIAAIINDRYNDDEQKAIIANFTLAQDTDSGDQRQQKARIPTRILRFSELAHTRQGDSRTGTGHNATITLKQPQTWKRKI